MATHISAWMNACAFRSHVTSVLHDTASGPLSRQFSLWNEHVQFLWKQSLVEFCFLMYIICKRFDQFRRSFHVFKWNVFISFELLIKQLKLFISIVDETNSCPALGKRKSLLLESQKVETIRENMVMERSLWKATCKYVYVCEHAYTYPCIHTHMGIFIPVCLYFDIHIYVSKQLYKFTILELYVDVCKWGVRVYIHTYT